MSNEQIMQIGVGLLLAAYAYIFNTQNKKIEDNYKSHNKRIKDLECLDCNPETCRKRFEKIEDKQDKLDPVLTEIKVQLARIEVTLQELKGK